ncbi:MAG: TlpA family protein disulfide reductase [Lachnospiraceae bacterium]|nr:TlpA family protein disulfide reductase [Lachnospiraceae bacterium]
MRKLKKIIVFLLCSVMLLCAGCGDGEKNDTDRKTENDTQSQSDEVDSQEASSDDRVQIDNFEMTLLDGTKTSFEEYKGKKILLNFWATWCGPCVGEMPAFQKLSEEYTDELVILAVNCSEDKDTVQKFIDNNGYTFPIVLDEDGAIQTMFGGIYSIPVTVIIDEEGYIVSSHVGAADADTMYETYKSELSLE